MHGQTFIAAFQPAIVFALGVAGVAFIVFFLQLRPRHTGAQGRVPSARLVAPPRASDEARTALRWALTVFYAGVAGSLAGALALWIGLAAMLISGWFGA